MLRINSSIGLDIGDESVRIVELDKFSKRIRLLKFGEERIEPNDSTRQQAIEAIKRLFHRLRIEEKEVVIHLGGVGVRHMLLEAPVLSQTELGEWVRRQCGERLPKNGGLSQFLFSYHVTRQNSDGTKLMVSYCQPHVLQEKLGLVEEAGLRPIMVGAGRMDLANAFALDYEDLFAKTFLFVEANQCGAAFLVCADGSPVSYREVDWRTDGNLRSHDEDELRRVITSAIESVKNGYTRFDKAIFVGENAEHGVAQSVLPSDTAIETGKPLQALCKNGNALPSQYSLAAGLALKRYFPLLNTIDLLPADKKQLAEQQLEKKRALRFILIPGAMIFFILLVLNVLKFVFTDKLSASQEETAVLQSQLFDVEQLQAQQAKLQSALADMQRLVTQRSNAAELLEEISRLMSEGVWLQEIAATPVDTARMSEEKNRVQLRGWAFDEGKVAMLLEQLESSARFSEVRLVATTRLPAPEVWKRTKLKKIDLVEFTITSVAR